MVKHKDGDVYYIPQRDLILGENKQKSVLYDISCYTTLHVITTMVVIGLDNTNTLRSFSHKGW